MILKYFLFFEFPEIISKLGLGILGECAIRSNRISAYVANTAAVMASYVVAVQYEASICLFVASS